MNTALKLVSIYLSLLLSSPKVEIYIYGENSLMALTNCKSQLAEFDYTISTNANETVKAYSFDLGNTEFEIYNNNKKISKLDTIDFDSQKPIHLKLKYTLNTIRPALFTFATNKGTKLFDSIRITYGDYNLTVEDIKKNSSHTFNVSKNCNDSIRIHFSPGGTSTSVVLYKILNSGKKEFMSAVGILGENEFDYFTFTRKDIGRYLVSYSSCHWRKRFWLGIK
jgi:hypothetical protein